MEHIRDSFRFKTVVNTFDDIHNAVSTVVNKSGAQIVKTDLSKMVTPTEYGWRIASFDLRMPNGQLVEYLLPFAEIETAKNAKGHKIFEEIRGLPLEESRTDAAVSLMQESRDLYQRAWDIAMARLGLDATAAAAEVKSLSSSDLSTPRKLSSKSTPANPPASQGPSADLRMTTPSGRPTKALPSSSSTITTGREEAPISTPPSKIEN